MVSRFHFVFLLLGSGRAAVLLLPSRRTVCTCTYYTGRRNELGTGAIGGRFSEC